ncbi:MAG TPA: TlpA disulfide reductase family protein, partial [Pseudomonadales bacterium]|nr:TlpA disulfide reductase family protein [Pseudomonadales bacterium]
GAAVMRFILNKALLVLFFGLASLVQQAYADPALNTRAPDFTLKSTTGGNMRLSEQRGQIILLNFWATWCGPCRQELPEFEKLKQKYAKYGFEVWAVNVDNDSNEALKFIKPLGITYPVLFDSGLNISQQYKVETMPSTFLLDRDGRVRFIHHGFQPSYVEKYDAEIHQLVKE